MNKFEGKVAFITGATSGIGAATAKTLAHRGVKVVVSGRREALGQNVVNQIRGDGGEANFIATDVNKEASIGKAISSTVDQYGSLDIGVNNAGVSLETLPLADSDVAPGAIRTDIILDQMGKGMYDENKVIEMFPAKRMGNPQEIANGIVWLCSDESSYATGTILAIDGGFNAG